MPGCERLLEYEEYVSRLLADGRLDALALVCHVDQRRFPDRVLRDLEQVHPFVLTAEQAQRQEPLLRIASLDSGAGLRLAGQVDVTNVRALATALDAVFRPDGDIHLDLAGVSFMDVAAVRLIAHAAARLDDGHLLVLRSPSLGVRAVLRVYRWDELPALRLVEGWDS
jgi:anti-anti-sigma factor